MTTVTIIRNLASQEGSVLKFKVRNFTQWLNKKKQEWRLKGYFFRTNSNEYNRQGFSSVRLVAYRRGEKCFVVIA